MHEQQAQEYAEQLAEWLCADQPPDPATLVALYNALTGLGVDLAAWLERYAQDFGAACLAE